MSRFRLIKNSLLGGQISGDALGRTDLPQYPHSCEILQNMIPMLSGGAYRRPGTTFQDYVNAEQSTPGPTGVVHTNASSPPRLFPFIVSNAQAYALLIGTMQYGQNIAATESGGGYLKYYQASGNNNADVAGTTIYNCLPYRSKSLGPAVTDTYQSTYTRQGGPGAVANTGTNPASATILDVPDSLQTYDDDIWSVQFCQANDVMFMTHPDYQPQTISVTDGTMSAVPYDYGLTSLQLCQSRPYLNQNTTPVTMIVAGVTGGSTQTIVVTDPTTPSDTITQANTNAGGTGTLTSSVAFFNALHAPRTGILVEGSPRDGAFFALAIGEGDPTQVTDGSGGGGILYCQVISVTSSTECQVTFPNGIPPAWSDELAAQTAWWESAWSNYRGWPGACCIYEQRLAMAATPHQPNAIWFTATGAYGAPNSALGTFSKFTALGDWAQQGVVAGATGTLANGSNYDTPQDWVYYPVDDSQGNGQSTGPLGTQPFRISLATTTLDSIKYLSPDQQLFLGTATQEWIIAPVSGAFDAGNSTCTIQSHYGSDLIQAIRIGYELMFVLQNRKEVRAYQYNYFDQSFFGEPVQLFFDEFPEDEEGAASAVNPLAGRQKYRQIDWDSTRATLWNVDTAGNLFGLTRDRKLSITTWHTHQFGGFNSAHGGGQNLTTGLTNTVYTDSAYFQCDGSVLSVATVPNPLSGIRDIWLVIKRSIANNTIFSVERMIGANTIRQSAYSVVAPGNAQEPLYVDCAYFLTDNGNPTDFAYTVGKQLSGQTLVGTYYSEAYGIFAIGTQAAVDSSGNISLQTSLPPDYGTDAVHTMVVGLPYIPVIQPVRPDPQSQIGTSQGAVKRVSKCYIRVYKTMFFQMGAPPTSIGPAVLEQVRFPLSASLVQSPEIFTGDREVFLPTTYTRDGRVYIQQADPLPFTFVSLSMEGEEYEQ